MITLKKNIVVTVHYDVNIYYNLTEQKLFSQFIYTCACEEIACDGYSSHYNGVDINIVLRNILRKNLLLIFILADSKQNQRKTLRTSDKTFQSNVKNLVCITSMHFLKRSALILEEIISLCVWRATIYRQNHFIITVVQPKK